MSAFCFYFALFLIGCGKLRTGKYHTTEKKIIKYICLNKIFVFSKVQGLCTRNEWPKIAALKAGSFFSWTLLPWYDSGYVRLTVKF